MTNDLDKFPGFAPFVTISVDVRLSSEAAEALAASGLHFAEALDLGVIAPTLDDDDGVTDGCDDPIGCGYWKTVR